MSIVATIHSVLVSLDEQVRAAIDSERLERLASAVMEREGLPPGEVSVLITDDEMVRRLNREYAGEDTPTDVLAFSLTEGEEFASPDDVLRLGEVIISYPTARRQADDAQRPVRDEIEHLLVHGVLHLLGYDHAEPAEEERMRGREHELLAALS
ncbi:MAG: rRNA maturation RNase YbeY [Chloroflexi bacterium]|nr:MAG: rRNA maturation RNase YbeY [Chloroflexota bacterium]